MSKWTLEQKNAYSIRKNGMFIDGSLTIWNKGRKCPQLSGVNNGFYGKKHSKSILKCIGKKISKHHKEAYRSGELIHPMLGKHHSVETRKLMSKIKKVTTLGCMNGFYGKHHSEEVKDNLRRIMKLRVGDCNPFYGRNHSVATRALFSEQRKMNKNSNWNGGSSYEPYSILFTNQLKEDVRDRYGRICFMCAKHEYEKKLAVHHVDYDKGNNDMNNLVPLHECCHVKTNSGKDNREHWKNIFQDDIVKLVGGE